MCSCLGLCGSRRVCQGTMKLLPSQKKLVCVCNQGDTWLQPKERINILVCDLHQTKQGREQGALAILVRNHELLVR